MVQGRAEEGTVAVVKKIPTLFERKFENHKVVGISDTVTPGCEWVLEGEGVATVKHDGSCCAIINGELYKRYDAKKGKTPPKGAVPCCDPDPVTGHWPHWVKCDRDNPSDKWFFRALDNTFIVGALSNGTYEAVGPHFQGNPEGYYMDWLRRHGVETIPEEDIGGRSFKHICDYLYHHDIEGIVFWKDGEPGCKIKRSDFGFDWPVKEESE